MQTLRHQSTHSTHPIIMHRVRPCFYHCFWLLAISCFPFAIVAGQDAELAAKIEKAEEDLFLAEATEIRVAKRLRDLEADPDADPAAIDTMRRYLQEINALAQTHRDTLADLRQSAGAPGTSLNPIAVDLDPEGADTLAGPDDELDDLMAEFQASLDQFDLLLHDHFQQTREAMNRRIDGRGEQAQTRDRAAAEAAELLRQMGVDPGIETDAVDGETASNDRDAGGEPGQEPGRESRPRETVGTGSESADPESGSPSSRPPRDDEDIVARQLREAAEKETDPVLRERLWKEYDAYLDGRG